MILYSGSRFPEWKGSALIGGLWSQALIRVPTDGNKAARAERLNMGLRICEVIEARMGPCCS